MTFKAAMGILSVGIMAVAYAVYLWQTIRNPEIRPHPFSWLLWGVVTGVAYLVQISQGAGPGSWVVGCTSAICIVIGLASLGKERWRFSRFDKFSLLAGAGVFIYYLSVRNPVISAISATIVDVIGYGPTLKKGWAKPYDDSVSSFALNAVKFVPSLFALKSYSITTWLYPATLVAMNGLVALMLVYRRRPRLDLRTDPCEFRLP